MKVIKFFSALGKPDLEAMIAGCLVQDERSQQQLFKRCAAKVLTTCRRYETRSMDARDILQETFITVFEKIAQYDPAKASIETWINRIAINTALKAIRKEKPPFLNLELAPDLPDEPATEEPFEYTEEQLLAMIQDLPIGYRTVFNLYVIDGYSHNEIAETLNISPQTSKSQLFKAKSMLKRQLLAEKKND